MSKPDDDVRPSPIPLLPGALTLVTATAVGERRNALADEGKFLIDLYMVGVCGILPSGERGLFALSPLRYTAATAVREHDELCGEFPGCAVLTANLVIDLEIPSHVDELVDATDRMLAEMRGLQ